MVILHSYVSLPEGMALYQFEVLSYPICGMYDPIYNHL